MNYPELTKSDHKDALTPDPQEFDFTDPNKSKKGEEPSCKSAKCRPDLLG